MFSQDQEFKKADQERKIELIEIDAYNLMIKYLMEEMEFMHFHNQIEELSKLGFHSKTELIVFLKSRMSYEALEYSYGKDEALRNQIKNRVRAFMEG